MCLELIGINKDIKNLTMKLTHAVLGPSNGDFDGDVYNISPILFAEFQEKFKKMYSPQRMTISTVTGKYNRRIGIIKDISVALGSFCCDDFDEEDFDEPPFSLFENN
jgi:hypothetical protein